MDGVLKDKTMTTRKIRLAIMASGKGSNAEAIIKFSLKKEAAFEVVVIITNNPDAGVIEIAKKYSVVWECINFKSYINQSDATSRLIETIDKMKVEMIALAGYLQLIPEELINKFPNRILNIHPSLLPKYGGKGMYGLRVHKKVIENREQISGSSVHIVENEYDSGKILCQSRVKIEENELPMTLSEKVLQEEHIVYPLVLNEQSKQIISGL
ncbi:MAG: phosphoribosylglycinamide formyltransferase [Ignavibacteriae bacterium]|nr:phosphoribosylglycinamide formyltransferase [Ignavibacteriota bacterium]